MSTTPQVLRHLSPAQVAEVRGLVDAAAAADGVPPLSDHVLLHLPHGGDADVRHLLSHDPGSGALVGYAHLDVTDEVAGPSGELVVHPGARRRGTGRALAQAVLAEAGGRLRLWSHGERPGAAELAAEAGFARSRVLWQMRRPLSRSAELPPVHLPEGIGIRTFEVGQDEERWTEVNNRAFASHPDQGRWAVEEVRLREAEPWFDPKGFFLAERDGQLVGFHWTKVHGHSEGDHEALGEVYVVGVDPAEQGRGLGPALTLLGLHSLADRGLPEALLYVDEGNTSAIKVYERLGFTRYATDVCFLR